MGFVASIRQRPGVRLRRRVQWRVCRRERDWNAEVAGWAVSGRGTADVIVGTQVHGVLRAENALEACRSLIGRAAGDFPVAAVQWRRSQRHTRWDDGKQQDEQPTTHQGTSSPRNVQAKQQDFRGRYLTPSRREDDGAASFIGVGERIEGRGAQVLVWASLAQTKRVSTGGVFSCDGRRR